jgi:hypothetical protein
MYATCPSIAERHLQGTWQFMAARLLISKEPLIQTLADNLESFLHVLSWVALRYILTTKALTTFVDIIFDQGLDGSSEGEFSKKELLISGAIPRSGFHNHKVTALLRALTLTVAARYEEDLSSENEDFEQEATEDTLVKAAAKRQAKLAALETSDWMLRKLRESTANRK